MVTLGSYVSFAKKDERQTHAVCNVLVIACSSATHEIR
jgi:hypothetical protein